jgi:hypothetical protein
MTAPSSQGSEIQFIIEGTEGKQPGTDKTLVRPPRRPAPNIPKITMPYPPKVTALELIEKAKLKRTATKSPNKFLIYRKEFVKELNRLGIQCSMTDISKFIGESWKQEPKHVKDAYVKISDEANRLHKQIIGVPTIMKKKNHRKKSSNKYLKLSNDEANQIIGVPTEYNPSLLPASYTNYPSDVQMYPPTQPLPPPPSCIYDEYDYPQQHMYQDYYPSYQLVPGISN